MSKDLEDILLEFYDEYETNPANRPIIPRIYAEEFVKKVKELEKAQKNKVNISAFYIPLSEDLEEAAKQYRKYREDCGYKDSVGLDEIEDAYYKGMIDMKERMKEE